MNISNLQSLNRVLASSLASLLLLFPSSCCYKTHSGTSEPGTSPKQAGPPVIIYKTKADYFDKVPVILSDDKNSVVSFPGPGDVYYQGQLAYPTRLSGDYLLDNRGIGPGVAFLKLTYEEYSRLPSAPEPAALLGMILEDDPLTVMYHCGNRYQYKDLVDELNRQIEKGDFSPWEKLK